MKYSVGDRVKVKLDMFEGDLAKGSLGTIRKAYGLVSYKVKFDGVRSLVRVRERNLGRA